MKRVKLTAAALSTFLVILLLFLCFYRTEKTILRVENGEDNLPLQAFVDVYNQGNYSDKYKALNTLIKAIDDKEEWTADHRLNTLLLQIYESELDEESEEFSFRLLMSSLTPFKELSTVALAKLNNKAALERFMNYLNSTPLPKKGVIDEFFDTSYEKNYSRAFCLRIRTIEALGNYAYDGDLVQFLLAILKDENQDSASRAYSASSLGKIKAKNIASELNALLNEDIGNNIKDAIIGTLAEIGNDESVKVLSSILNDSNVNIKETSYGDYSPGRIQLRRLSALSLAQLDSRGTIDYMKTVIKNTKEDELLRLYCIAALTKLSDTSQIQFFEGFKNEPNMSIRCNIIIALCCLDQKNISAYLEQFPTLNEESFILLNSLPPEIGFFYNDNNTISFAVDSIKENKCIKQALSVLYYTRNGTELPAILNVLAKTKDKETAGIILRILKMLYNNRSIIFIEEFLRKSDDEQNCRLAREILGNMEDYYFRPFISVPPINAMSQ